MLNVPVRAKSSNINMLIQSTVCFTNPDPTKPLQLLYVYTYYFIRHSLSVYIHTMWETGGLELTLQHFKYTSKVFWHFLERKSYKVYATCL